METKQRTNGAPNEMKMKHVTDPSSLSADYIHITERLIMHRDAPEALYQMIDSTTNSVVGDGMDAAAFGLACRILGCGIVIHADSVCGYFDPANSFVDVETPIDYLNDFADRFVFTVDN